MKVLIIGSEGFIGKNIMNHLTHCDFTYVVSGCDLLDQKNTTYVYYKIDRLSPSYSDIIRESQPDMIINAAGSGSVPLSMANPLGDFQANTLDHFYLLESIRQHQQKCKYIYFSSAAVYGNPLHLPVAETDSITPLSPYGWHKYYSELICQEYFKVHNIKTIIVRPFSVYGPGLKKQLFWDLYQKSLNAENIVLFGTGEETRDFIYIDDLAASIEAILRYGEFNAQMVNIGVGKSTTIEKVASLFLKLINPNLQLSFNGQVRDGDPRFWQADVKKILSWGFLPKTTIEEGLSQYIQWLKEKE